MNRADYFSRSNEINGLGRMYIHTRRPPSPLEGEGGSARSAETDEGCWKEQGISREHSAPSNTPHPPSLRSGTFSLKGRRKGRIALGVRDNQRPFQLGHAFGEDRVGDRQRHQDANRVGVHAAGEK